MRIRFREVAHGAVVGLGGDKAESAAGEKGESVAAAVAEGGEQAGAPRGQVPRTWKRSAPR